jgi:SAM-dependent methyltransferase
MNNKSDQSILPGVRQYFDDKISTFGPNHLGVGWNSAESQELRFEQFFHLFGKEKRFSLNDIGCGYGQLLDFLTSRTLDVDYLGIDVSPIMIDKARELHRSGAGIAFETASECERVADYSVASGIFNVKMNLPADQWTDYVLRTVDSMHRSCSRGFAFNVLTKYSDAEKMRGDLYYADPALLFDVCKTRYSRNVALLHDYGLYEFTVIVRK